MLGTRSKLSLCQFLCLQNAGQVEVILNKRGVAASLANTHLLQALRRCLFDARPEQIEAVLDEIVNSQRLLYDATASPKYLYNERWLDLIACVALDGYQIRGPQRSLQNRPMVVTPKPANGKRGSDNIRYTPLSLGPARSFGVRSSLGERPKGASRGRVGGGGRRRRPCGNVGIARLAISKRGGKRRETAVWFSAFSTVRHFHRVIGLPPISCASSLARI
jgi:hypothetical protein